MMRVVEKMTSSCREVMVQMSAATVGAPTVIEILNGRTRDLGDPSALVEIEDDAVDEAVPSFEQGENRAELGTVARDRVNPTAPGSGRARSPLRGDGCANIEPTSGRAVAGPGVPVIVSICADGKFGSVGLIEA
jgi:hypothetical protein